MSSQEITKAHCAHVSQQKKRKQKKRKPRGPVAPRTVGGRVTLTKRAGAASIGMSVAHLNRCLREGKIKLTLWRPYPGALPRLFEDEIEALKQGGAS